MTTPSQRAIAFTPAATSACCFAPTTVPAHARPDARARAIRSPSLAGAPVAFALAVAVVPEVLGQHGERVDLRMLALARQQAGHVGRPRLGRIDAVGDDVDGLADLVDRHFVDGLAEELLDGAGASGIGERHHPLARGLPQRRRRRRTPQKKGRDDEEPHDDSSGGVIRRIPRATPASLNYSRPPAYC